MLQIEIRANGALLDFVTITRTRPISQGVWEYQVEQDRAQITVEHVVEDGAAILAERALQALRLHRERCRLGHQHSVKSRKKQTQNT